MSWTEERIEIAKTLWLEGRSASQVARALGGVTRNAVIGKLTRMGLTRASSDPSCKTRAVAGVQPRRQAASAPGLMAPLRVRRQAAHLTIVSPVAEPAPAREVLCEPAQGSDEQPSPAPEGGVALFDLERGQCNFPLDGPAGADLRCCGAQTADKDTYCTDHRKLAGGRRAPPSQADAIAKRSASSIHSRDRMGPLARW